MFKKDDINKDVEDVVIEEPKVYWEMQATSHGDYELYKIKEGEDVYVAAVKSPSDARKAIKNYNRDTIKLDDNGQVIHEKNDE